MRRDPISASRRDPLHRQNPRSFKNLLMLVGGYVLTGACFWIAFTSVPQHKYGDVAFGICSGLFFGLGCALLTWLAIQGPIRRLSPTSSKLANDTNLLTSELVDLTPDVPGVALISNLVYKLLPYNTGEVSLDIAADPASVDRLAKDILDEEGHLLSNEEMPEQWQVKGVIGAGWSDLNPAIVTISISESENHHSHVSIQGKAKEGLIKQHAGEKAAQRIAEQLAAQVPEAT